MEFKTCSGIIRNKVLTCTCGFKGHKASECHNKLKVKCGVAILDQLPTMINPVESKTIRIKVRLLTMFKSIPMHLK